MKVWTVTVTQVQKRKKIVCITLINFFEKHTILLESQHVFHIGRSTSIALINFLEDDKEACVGLFLDLSKASDLVNHNILLQKLDVYGN
jgi:hypothetical protein